MKGSSQDERIRASAVILASFVKSWSGARLSSDLEAVALADLSGAVCRLHVPVPERPAGDGVSDGLTPEPIETSAGKSCPSFRSALTAWVRCEAGLVRRFHASHV